MAEVFCQRGLGEHQRALDVVTALLPIRVRVNGKEHPETLATRFLEARILNSCGQHKRALEAFETLLPMAERVWGNDHPDTLTARFHEAHILSCLDEHQRALDVVTSVLPIRERVSGKEHPDTLATHRLYAEALIGCEQPDVALKICNEIAVVQTPSARLRTDLVKAKALSALGRSGDALSLVERVIEQMNGHFTADHNRLRDAENLRAKLAAGC